MQICEVLRSACHRANNSAAADACRSGAASTKEFIEKNYKSIFIHTIALVAIVLAASSMHGWEEVGEPLAISLAAGSGIGILSGIIVNINSESPTSCWSWLQKNFLERIEDPVMNYLFISVMVALYIHTLPHFPYIGGALGFIMGNHIVTPLPTDEEPQQPPIEISL